MSGSDQSVRPGRANGTSGDARKPRSQYSPERARDPLKTALWRASTMASTHTPTGGIIVVEEPHGLPAHGGRAPNREHQPDNTKRELTTGRAAPARQPYQRALRSGRSGVLVVSGPGERPSTSTDPRRRLARRLQSVCKPSERAETPHSAGPLTCASMVAGGGFEPPTFGL